MHTAIIEASARQLINLFISLIVLLVLFALGGYEYGYYRATKDIDNKLYKQKFECEVVDYTSKTGFFTAVRLGTIAKGAVEKLD